MEDTAAGSGLLGKLGAVNVQTGVTLDSRSLVNIGLLVFISACLVLGAVYTFRKIA